ncbi:sensor histidine kinase [Dehalogenimonas alkenigignens]|uniref:histidine kinase n=1 Tax=Dehalogenimonas alkenigignens TaxID=1217799 RepID=A0A0W0GJZ1_9CHLR|nr:His Kinase A (phospho-acceptor) domain/Histidine kinase-, DNA gyrase B-, and HSP90-like ATPase [Dehalogenimonas alkenigignens]PVV85210.1 sensor histidine kinase [Dehalogenimonas alkenigignens]
MEGSEDLVREYTRTESLGGVLGTGLNPIDGLGIYEENPNPVIRASKDGVILYSNPGSLELCRKWDCAFGGLVPKPYKRLIEDAIQTMSTRWSHEKVDNITYRLQIVPVPGHDYVNIFGFATESPDVSDGNRRQRQSNLTRAAVHELKNPLTPILAASEMLVNRLPDGTPARLAKQINLGAIELNSRIGELFELIRGEMGTLVLDYQQVELSELCQQVVDSLQPEAADKGINLHVESTDRSYEVTGDRRRLRESMGHLVKCAIKRSSLGAEVRLTLGLLNQAMIVRIITTCLNFPDRLSAVISAPYSVLTLDRDHFSTLGLELTLSKLLIELHGGDVKVTDNSRGCCFEITLPVEPAISANSELQT